LSERTTEREWEQAIGVDLPDPNPCFHRLRQEAPVHGNVLRDEFGFASPVILDDADHVFTVIGYDGVTAVHRDPESFSTVPYEETIGRTFGRNILVMDGPEHRDKRRLMQQAFTRQIADRWRETIVVPVIRQLVDVIADKGRADLIGEFAAAFPITITLKIIGLPSEQIADYYRLTHEMCMIGMNPELGLASSQQLARMLSAEIDRRGDDGGEDLISILLRAREGPLALTEEDVLGFLRLILSAGTETTTRATGSLLVALLSDPAQLALVREDPERLVSAVDETVRLEPPAPFNYRRCMKDAVLEGVDIPAGSTVITSLAAANRDPVRFANPDTFDLNRPDLAGHVGFGWGGHLCVGLHLARAEVSAAVAELLARLPNLRLDESAPAPEIVGLAYRGPLTVPAVWDVESPRT
jgi:cytochrome P450